MSLRLELLGLRGFLQSDEYARVRWAAVGSLEGVAEALPRLAPMYLDRSRKVRSAAVEASLSLRE